jgi:hypothetical protein
MKNMFHTLTQLLKGCLMSKSNDEIVSFSIHKGECLTLVEEIDRELIEEEVDIFDRPLMALEQLGNRLNIQLPMHPLRGSLHKEYLTLEDTSIFLYQWFEARYGRRQCKPFAIGYAVVFIRGAFYRLHIPLRIEKDGLGDHLNRYGPLLDGVAPTMEMLHLVEDMTPDMSRHLAGYELLRILATLDIGMKAYGALNVLDDIPRVNQANADLSASAHHLMQQNPQCGLSRWASLQATEKVIKQFIKQHDPDYKFGFGHSLDELYDAAEKWGLEKPPKKLIDAVQCDQGVRYNDPPTSEEEALISHSNSLQLIAVAAQSLAVSINRTLPEVPDFRIEGRINGKRRTMTVQEIVQASN